MKVTTAMLADAAVLQQDGKLYINGGGWNTLFTASFPTAHPALGLVLIFSLDWHEANEDIPIVIELVDEDNQPTPLRGAGNIRVAPQPYETKGAELINTHAQMFYGLVFEKAGRFRFRILSNDAELASVPLTVRHFVP